MLSPVSLPRWLPLPRTGRTVLGVLFQLQVRPLLPPAAAVPPDRIVVAAAAPNGDAAGVVVAVRYDGPSLTARLPRLRETGVEKSSHNE